MNMCFYFSGTITMLPSQHRERADCNTEAYYLVMLNLTVISCSMGHGCGSLGKQFAFEEWFENIYFNKVHWALANKTLKKR